MPNPAHDRDWYEREYNPQVPPADDPSIHWEARAAATWARHPPVLNIPTGNHPRELLDLFRADAPKGTVVFIHGGFWRVSSKDEMLWVADGFVDNGYSVALLNYPLCPEVSLETLTESVRRSFARLCSDVLSDGERSRIVVTGHSAGGYLALALVATNWRAYGLPSAPFHGAVAVSGLFELAPLLQTVHNQTLRLDARTATRLNITNSIQAVSVPVVLAVGEAETSEFHRQSKVMADAWRTPKPSIAVIPRANHYSVIEGMSVPGSMLNSIIVEMLR